MRRNRAQMIGKDGMDSDDDNTDKLSQFAWLTAAAGYRKQISIWNSAINTPFVIGRQSPTNCIAFSSTQNSLAAAFHNIEFYDLNRNCLSHTFEVRRKKEDSKNVTAIGFHETDKFFYVGTEDRMVMLFDPRCDNECIIGKDKFTSSIRCMTLHPNQKELFVADDSGDVHILNLDKKFKESVANSNSSASPVANSSTNEKKDNNHPTSYQYTLLQPFFSNVVQCMDVDLEMTRLALGFGQGTLQFWPLDVLEDNDYSLKCSRFNQSSLIEEYDDGMKERICHANSYILKCRYSPDNTLFVTCSSDGTAKLWRTRELDFTNDATILPRSPNEDKEKWIWDCCWTKDSRYVLTASTSGVVNVYDTDARRLHQYKDEDNPGGFLCLALRETF
ncbi:hypothetical protein SNEBB_011126 [Seison nebaliae]|nr:hypothetical protein SNEBB_011126 [Seison nebaliae]